MNEIFTSLISLIPNNFEPNWKRVSKFGQRASFLQKLTKNVHGCGKLLAPQFDTNNQFSLVFNRFEYSSELANISNFQWNMVSYSLPKVKMRYFYFFSLTS